MKNCPFCAEEIQDDAIKCKHCGEMLVGDAESSSPTRQTGSPTLNFLGALLFIGGLIAAVYYYQFFDTSVAVPVQEVLGQRIGGGRVHNLGLLQQRQNGLMIGGAVAAGGFLLLILGQYFRTDAR